MKNKIADSILLPTDIMISHLKKYFIHFIFQTFTYELWAMSRLIFWRVFQYTRHYAYNIKVDSNKRGVICAVIGLNKI